MINLARYWKGIIAFVAPGAVIIGSATLDASDGGSSITHPEIITALVACVVTSAGVIAKGNADPPVTGHDEATES